jgi:hypothetical protein
MRAIADYLATLDSETPTTLDEFSAAVVAMQRAGNTFAARLALELAELDAAHADEATRRLALEPVERGRGQQPAMYGALENATQRTKFLQDRWNQVGVLLTQLRTAANDLRDDQKAIRRLADGKAADGILADSGVSG